MSDLCDLFAAGDIVVHGMIGAERRAATEIYKDAPKADLPPSG